NQRHQRNTGRAAQGNLHGRLHALIVSDIPRGMREGVALSKTPEQWLEHAAPEKKSGILKVFLGYAPGVGKTYSMLSEAIRRSKRGEDVAIGVVETHGRKGVVELVDHLPAVPRRKLEYKGTMFEEMD